jgi:DNA-binding beta-propeller fold protein YncE
VNFSSLRNGCVFLLLALASAFSQAPGSDHTVMLPTSKMLTVPSPGRIGSTNGFSGTMVVSPDGRYAAILNYGYGTQETLAHQSISVLDLKTNQIADFPDQRFGTENKQSCFVGLEFSSDGKHLYASVGSLSDTTGEKSGDLGNGVAVYGFRDGKIAPERFIRIPLQPLSTGKRIPVGMTAPPHMAIPYPAGIAIIADHGHDKLLIANNLSDNAILLDPATGKTLQSFDLSTRNLVPSSYPYTCVATKDGRRAWCSLWNASQVAELDLTSGKIARWIDVRKAKDPIAPGSHPTAMLLSPDEKTIYVALSNAGHVEAISTELGTIVHSFWTASSQQSLESSFPVALAQSKDGNRVFVADASLDAVAVLNSEPVVTNAGTAAEWMEFGTLGLIPTDWYPTALAVHGDELLIASAKGEGTGPNPGQGKTAYEVKHHAHPYIPTLLKGSIARLNIPSTIQKLPQYTQMVENNNLLHSDPGTIAFASGKNPIKHVIYIIKENRTYDQILGDLKIGDSDPSLTMYGEDITPNLHKLARQFGVLDNFYDSGEVSGDGHLWSTAAITSDYNEKTWQIAYRGKERTYDFQGQVADEFPLDHNQPDIDDSATGFIWDNLARNNVSFRDYGEFVNAIWCNEKRKAANPKEGTPSGLETHCEKTELQQGDSLPPNIGDPHGSPSPYPWAIPLFNGVKPTKAVLRDHYDPLFPDFNTDYPDQLRTDEFLNEFGAFVRARQE